MLRQEIGFAHRDDGDAKHPIFLKHIKGHINATVDRDHARIFAAAPAAARWIHDGRVATQIRRYLRILRDVRGVGELIIESDAVRTRRVAEPRHAVHADSAIHEVRAVAEFEGCRVQNRFRGPGVRPGFQDGIMG